METKQSKLAQEIQKQIEKSLPKPVVFTEREAAAYLACTPQSLRLSRHYRNKIGYAVGPPFIRLGGGRAIRYLKTDLDDWLLEYRQSFEPLPKEW